MKTLGVLAFLAACGVFLFGPVTGCSCTQAGCANGVSSTLTVAGDAASLAGAVVTACRGDQCEEGTLDLLDGSSELICNFPNDTLEITRSCHGVTTGDEVSIEVRILISDEEPEDGESFSFSLASAADPDEVLAESEGKVEYEETYPNGEICGPTCYEAKL